MREFSSDRAAGDEPRPNPFAGFSIKLDGEEYQCQGQIGLLDVSELAGLAVAGLDPNSLQGVAMTAQYLQLAFGPLEYMRLKSHFREYQTPQDVIFAIVAEITDRLQSFMETQTGRPTGPPLPSFSGPADKAERIARIGSLDGDLRLVPEQSLPGPATG